MELPQINKRPGLPASAEQGRADSDPESPPNPKPLRDRIIYALQQVYDPEIPINIYELGLIYNIDIDDEKRVKVTMTLTTPNCPEAESLPGMVRRAIEVIPEVKECEVDLVWQPPWDKSMMSEDAKMILGIE